MARVHSWPFSLTIHRASRGIGLEITKQLISNPSNIVIASCRNPETAKDLSALKTNKPGGQLHIIKLDVIAEETIKDAAAGASSILGDKGLDYLLNNAGVVSDCTKPFVI